MRQMNPRKSDLSQHRLRRVIADAVSEKTQGDPHEYATRRWGADRPPPMIERAGVSGTVSGDASPFASESQATRLSYQQRGHSFYTGRHPQRRFYHRRRKRRAGQPWCFAGRLRRRHTEIRFYSAGFCFRLHLYELPACITRQQCCQVRLHRLIG